MNIVTGYRWADMPRLIAIAVLYALLAKGVLTFYSENGLVTVFWPAAGLSLATVLVAGKRFLPSIYIGALLGGVAADRSPGLKSGCRETSIRQTVRPTMTSPILTEGE